MLSSLIRVLILYPLVVFGVRLMGKRQIGELQPSELVVTILISNIATLPLEDQDLPLFMGMVPMLLLISSEVLLSFGVLKSRRLRHLISGTPQIIVRSGRPDQKVMASLRFTLDDLMTALRSLGIFDISEVQLAIVETNGTVSAYQKAYARPASCGDLKLDLPQKNPPEILIADGCICPEGLRALGMSQAQLKKLLSHKHLEAEALFLMTADTDGNCNFIEKENVHK
ncbi:MAG: DUF421 domain-containing protein [Oscillospiraceae bacterium]|nr:DUF421 domain-containing protein [Oscillospiraceae bacterium]